MTLIEIKKLVAEILTGSHQNSIHFRAGVIMFAVAEVGLDLNRVAEFTGYSLKRNIVPRVLDRMREFEFAKEGFPGISVTWYHDENTELVSTVAVICDIMVLSGNLTRTWDEKDADFLYSLREELDHAS